MKENRPQKPDAPVLELKVFVRLDGAVMTQQILEAMPGKPERTRRLMSVKHANNVDTKVALEPQHVMISTV